MGAEAIVSTRDEAAAAAIRAVFDRVTAEGMAPESVTGATDEQIDAYAAAQGVTAVPAAVRAVLRLLGVRHGLWRAGSSLGVDAVGGEAKRYARATLARDGGAIREPGGLLVLLMHQAYEFHVVDGADLVDPDPPVWLVTEGQAAQPVWCSVTDWFDGISPSVADYRSRLTLMAEVGRDVPSWAEYLRPTEG
ncbi:hypothetical protein Aru02nite_50650 [Actinocatenispora rupis]|uniref:Uncharacterized protein n=1 Tax=Actinocatenispora rupis TaxID=519421 RepID=A0A8J3J9H8_9ACTN|nr:hypothetical protein Aru02nite_50650 [Actinocatenispora rupis]